MQILCRGVRGAITAASNSRASILAATRDLLTALSEANGIRPEDIASVVFSTTADLNAAFPAIAARRLGWNTVPLLCTHEMDVPGALPRCIRVLLHWNTGRTAAQIRHLYLGGAAVLRPDLAEREARARTREPPRFGTVAVLGVGLMGGSLAAALRDAGCATRIVGYDASTGTARRALELGLLDDVADDDAAACAGASLIVLAAPTGALPELVRRAAPAAADGALLLDLGSVKRGVVAAMDALPGAVRAVGGHPMCGSERSGPDAADATLFRGAPFVLCRTARTDEAAVRDAEALARAVGARPVWLTAADHDARVAAVSHLPYLLSAALVRAVDTLDPSAWELAATGFRDATRLAAGEPTIMADILLANLERLGLAAAALRAELDALLALARSGDLAALRASLGEAATRRREWTPPAQ